MKQQQYENAQQRELLSSLFVATLVQVVSFSAAKMSVDVQPIIQKFTEGGFITPSQILEVPITCHVGGGFIQRPVYRAGDIGLVVYLDNDMDLAMMTGTSGKPMTERMHSGTDAVFIGGIVLGSNSVNLPAEGYAVGTIDGTTYLQITPNGIQIKGNLVVDGTVAADNI